jgi:cytochrome c oxidase subunit 2
MRGRAALAGVATGVMLTASCSGSHHVLDPKGAQAKSIAFIAWFMFASAAAVTLLVYVTLGRGLSRRRRTNRRGAERRFLLNEQTWVVAGGVVLPAVFIVVLTGMSMHVLRNQPASGALNVTVIGHQYWWEVDYPDLHVTTANELHIPEGRDVNVTLKSDDVIHSFWVPELAGKIDMIPGQTNHLTLHANRTGRFRGQCAEFCGLQHANMIFFVTADAAGDFDRWVDGQRGPASTPVADSVEASGEKAFMELPCASCHTIQGTGADGTRGPDLTHFASRDTLGAGVAPNNRGYLGGWIADAQSTKPGSLMPPVAMSPEQLNALIAYLESLR